MQWEETGSLPWFPAPTTCDTYSFNHLGCHATHPVAPYFEPICLANLRQRGSLNAHKFVHAVQGRKIPEMLFNVSSLPPPKNTHVFTRWHSTVDCEQGRYPCLAEKGKPSTAIRYSWATLTSPLPSLAGPSSADCVPT